jgi:glycosyltransferase involved in cell wall biosynthesis
MISVIIPAHNEEDYLAKTLTSISGSHGFNFESKAERAESLIATNVEIIVVCDQCNDNTVSIASKYTNQVVHSCFGSASAARNAGAEIANGEVLVFVDADTPLEPRYLANVEMAITAGADYGCAPFVSESGNKIGRYIARSFNRFNQAHKSFGGNFFVRRSSFVTCQGFNTSLIKGEDTDLGVRLNQLGCSYMYLDKTYVLNNERKFRQYGYVSYYLKLYFESVIYHFSPKLYCKYIGSTTDV